LRGSVTNDLMLEQGDVIFVPVHGSRVSVTGAVVRPATYELKPGETLAEATTMAGGLRPDAQTRRLAVYRIVPPETRLPGPVPRMVVDVPLGQETSANPGGAAGLATASRIVIPRVPLEPGDSIVVDSILAPERSLTVSIGGMVNKPGAYPWSDGLTVRDLLRLARGPTVGADLREAEIARLPEDRSGGALAATFRVPLDSSFLFERDSLGAYLGAPGVAFPPAGTAPDVKLIPYDQVTVFRQPGFEFQRTAWITGEVTFPGPYALIRKDERVSNLVQRAGGPLPSAYVDGARFFRSADSTGRVDLNLTAALTSPGQAEDLVLQPGDSLFVPEHNPTVRVTGAVNSPVSVRYVEGRGLDYYIGNAGGYASSADKGRVSVRYADGSARVRTRFLMFSSYPPPGPGSTVFVPAKPADGRGVDLPVLIGGIAQVLSALTTLILVARTL
ncbi:MAG TPA: SLBB domain-containing protein, partial [Gemmatimonadales bacterium]|nr:SLBB domain-containing protein [Gemmatimonadales bacterium]